MNRGARVIEFEAAHPPRGGQMVFRSAVGTDRRLPVEAALPELLASPAGADTAFWRAAAVMALRLVADQRIRPDPGGDGWRIGDLAAAEVAARDALAAIDACGGQLPGFLDAVADALAQPWAGAENSVQPPAGAEVGAQPSADQPPTGPAVRVSLRVEATDDDPATLRMVPQAHTRAEPARVVDVAELWRSEVAHFGRWARHDTLVALRRVAQVWPPLAALLERPVPDHLDLTDEELGDLLAGGAAGLEAAGVELHWPRELARDLSARVLVGQAGAAPPGWVQGEWAPGATLSAHWQLTLGGEPLSAAEAAALAEAHRPLVRLRHRWVLVDPEVLRRVRRRLAPLRPVEALAAALSGTTVADGHPAPASATGWLETVRQRLCAPPAPVPAPPQLAGTLREYQLGGLRWLARMTSLGLGACLADDMGLGKTITVIALHLHRQADPATAGPTLVVCPASLLGNWESEIRRFAPATAVRRFHGSGRALPSRLDGFVLTTYSTLRQDLDPVCVPRWGLVVADEAQHAKNPRSRTARALRHVPARARVALTGTPVENHLADLWAILDWTSPGLLGSLASFQARWADPIESRRDPEVSARFARLIGPFLLRRRKSDPGIAPELPRKTETDRVAPLTTEQAGLYQAVVDDIMAQLRERDDAARRGLILTLLTRLKQICNHPAQYLGEPRPRLVGRSGKLDLFDELLGTILAEQGATLVFTQYVAMARLLARHLGARGVATGLLHGGTPVRQRDELVRQFQAGELPVLLLSLKAAGTGLNLTRAEHVIHYDRWWNPAVEAQATDRAYRIGQTRPVQVHRLVSEGTVEERIAALLGRERELAAAVLTGTGEAALSELTDAELAALVELGGR